MNVTYENNKDGKIQLAIVLKMTLKMTDIAEILGHISYVTLIIDGALQKLFC